MASTTCVWSADNKPVFDGSLVMPTCVGVTNGDLTYEGLKRRATYDPMADPHSSDVIHGYGRNTNSTVKWVCDKMLQLEKGDPTKHSCAAFPSGMSAIYSTLESLLEMGERVVSIKDTYGGTAKHLYKTLPSRGREVTLCETEDMDAIEVEVSKGCKMLYIETPTNPTLKVMDIERMAKAVHKVGGILVVDNTFASPINQNPLTLGADLVVHSATKYINGHGDAMGGFLVGNKELVRKVYDFREIVDSMSPHVAALIGRGMKTLALRVRQHNKNAMAVAKLCESHPAVKAVYYPGLESHTHHDVARRQMTEGYGGMLSFELNGDESTMAKFLDKLEFAHLAASLGHVETLVGPPSATSHVECTQKEREELGISETLVRYSTGIEETEDLVNDVKNALDSLV